MNLQSESKNKAGISVIICCYNSSRRLPETIKYLAKQNVSRGIDWEIVIVNNASTDQTKEVAESEWKQYNNTTAFCVIDQSQPGLSAAREMGMQMAKYNYLLFCDDDNWLSPNYISIAHQAMQNDQQIGVLGGRGVPMPEPPVPDWFPKRTQHYAVGSQENFVREHWVYGAGSVYRKDALEKLREKGWHQVTTDRIGSKPMYGGDNELCYILALSGYKIAYNDLLEFKHFIPNNRITRKYINKNHYGSVFCNYLIYPYHYLLKQSKPFDNSKWKFTGYIVKTFLKLFLTNIAIIFYPGKFNKYNRELAFISLFAMIDSVRNTPKIYRQFQHVSDILNK